MELIDKSVLDYNTEREKLAMPEYGRNVLKMVEQLKAINDREKRSRQAAAVVKVMELLNPQVHHQENYEQKLWDHLYIMAGFDLDIDAPYPSPVVENLNSRPQVIPLKKKPIKAYHYGRNIESIIELIASEPEGEVRTSMIRSLAIYMRQQYLIWNKDSVADRTIFDDIEKMSEGRIKVPEGLSLNRISDHANFSRPMMSINVGQGQGNGGNGNRQWQRNNRRNGQRRK